MTSIGSDTPPPKALGEVDPMSNATTNQLVSQPSKVTSPTGNLRRKPSSVASHVDPDYSIGRTSTFSSMDSVDPPHQHHHFEVSASSPNATTYGAAYSKLTLATLNPLESEAETLLLKAMEQKDFVEQNRSRADSVSPKSIMANRPASSLELHAMTQGLESQRPTKSTHSPPHPRSRSSIVAQLLALKRNQTTEQTLENLTMAMESIQEDEKDVDAAPHSDAFHHAADKVLRRPSKRPSLNDASGTAPSSVSIRNWGKVRTAVRSRPNAVDADDGMSMSAGFPKSSAEYADESAFVDVECNGEPYSTPVKHSRADPTNDPHPLALMTPHTKSRLAAQLMVGPKVAVADLKVFVKQRRRLFFIYFNFLLFIVIPALVVSCVLFYLAGNPPTGRIDLDKSINGTWIGENGKIVDPAKASASWWILFLCVRQALTFSLAHLTQAFVIDFLCLNTKFFQSIVGNILTLLIVQSKGWPFISVTWGLLDFGLLHGTNKFASNWLYGQDVLDIFTEANPGGAVTSSIWNTRVLLIAVCVGTVVSVKRVWLGLFLGKKTIKNHADDLHKVYRQVLLLTDVAAIARDVKQNPSYQQQQGTLFGMTEAEFGGILRESTETVDSKEDDESHIDVPSVKQGPFSGRKLLQKPRNGSDPCQDYLNESQRRSMLEMLGSWEEPEATAEAEDNVSISAILLFEKLVTTFDKPYMFSLAWGDVSTRELMIASSESVFRRLVLGSPDPNVLKFEILARVAKRQDGSLDESILRSLIRLLRPNRDGNLNLLDFVKSVDSVYKDAKLLRASIRNSRKIDKAFEKFVNVIFFTVTICVVLNFVGIDPFALFLSLSSLILAFAWIVGSAASKMFEGWLFILVRRPYNIGDRIHISNSEQETNPGGSTGWIVKDVTLFHTTAVFAATGEEATLSNGSLAGSRIINMARSPNAFIDISFKFSTGVSHDSIELFDKALREFIKARPREWSKFCGFRVTKVVPELGYVEYSVLLTHREAWQNVKAIMESKATVASFCLELSKKLDMRFQCLPLPVDLAIVNRSDNNTLVSAMASAKSDDSGTKNMAAMYDKNK